MLPNEKLRMLLASLIATSMLWSGAENVLDSQSVSPLVKSFKGAVSTAFDPAVFINIAPTQLAAFEPLIDRSLNNGFVPEFLFRFDVAGFVIAGVRQTGIPSNLTSVSHWIDVNSVAIIHRLCFEEQNEKTVTTEACKSTRAAAAYTLRLILDGERVQNVPSVLEQHAHRELESMVRSHRFVSMAKALTAEEDRIATQALTVFTSKTLARASERNLKVVMQDVNETVVAVLGPPKRDPSIFDKLADDVSYAVKNMPN
jgi:hypothetical protein